MNQQTNMYMDDHKLEESVRSKRNVIKLLYIIRILDVVIPVAILLLGLILHWDEKYDTSVIMFLVILAIPGYILLDRQYKTRTNDLRDFVGRNITASVLAEQIQILEYQPNGYINESFLKNSNILTHYDRLEGSGYIRGIYRGAEFCFCNLKLFDEFRNPDGDNDCREIFGGWFILLPLRRSLAGYVKLEQRLGPRKLQGERTGVKDKLFGGDSAQKTLFTGNNAFDDRFDMYTSDPRLAYWLVTPQMMEYMMHMEGRVKMFFSGSMAYIAVGDVKPLFDIDSKIKSDRGIIDESRKKYRGDLSRVLSVIEGVILNSNLF